MSSMNPTRFADIASRLRLPLIAAPMFLVSGVELVIAACGSGIVGSFPTANCRSVEELESWLDRMTNGIREQEQRIGRASGPLCPNLIVHRSNTRLSADLAVLLRHQTHLVFTGV